jgi:dephospho-CoA kinase
LLRVGLTGGVACGKSVVLEMFARRGAHVIQADQIARQLMQPGQPVYKNVVAHFGRDILLPDGQIDRQKLAQVAFPDRIAELNKIVHPAVIKSQEDWMNRLAHKDAKGIAMVEAALILEAGIAKQFDKLVVVTCGLAQKIHRFAARHKLDPQTAQYEINRRMAAQLPDEAKTKAADFIIDNTGSLAEAERQVESVFAELRRLAENN